jgi:hypothetical protein
MHEIGSPIPLNGKDANPAATCILNIPIPLSLEFLQLYHHLRNPDTTDSHPLPSTSQTQPFAIKQRAGSLVYELDLPERMKVQPVISVAHL